MAETIYQDDQGNLFLDRAGTIPFNQSIDVSQQALAPTQGAGLGSIATGFAMDKAGDYVGEKLSSGFGLDKFFGGGASASAPSGLAPNMSTPFSGLESFFGTGAAPANMSVAPVAPSGLSSLAGYAVPALGVLGGANLLMQRRTKPLPGALQGAASGFAIGGPVGAAIGGAIGLGKGLLDKGPQTNVEQDRYADLIKGGYKYAPANATNKNKKGTYVAKGQSIRPDLANDFVGIDNGQFVNNRFSNSRSEGDLTGKDIWGYSAWGRQLGNDWMEKLNEQQREMISQEALNRGLVRENKGTIDINFDPGFMDYINQNLKGKIVPNSAKTSSPAPMMPKKGLGKPTPTSAASAKDLQSKVGTKPLFVNNPQAMNTDLNVPLPPGMTLDQYLAQFGNNDFYTSKAPEQKPKKIGFKR